MVEKLTADQIQEYRQAFDVMDFNKDGVITADDLKCLMQAIGQTPTANELQDMIREVDADGNDQIDFPEFLALMTRQMRPSDIEAELQETFKLMDKDSDGCITNSELHSLLNSLKLKPSQETVRRMINEADKDRDGGIGFREFKDYVIGK